MGENLNGGVAMTRSMMGEMKVSYFCGARHRNMTPSFLPSFRGPFLLIGPWTLALITRMADLAMATPPLRLCPPPFFVMQHNVINDIEKTVLEIVNQFKIKGDQNTDFYVSMISRLDPLFCCYHISCYLISYRRFRKPSISKWNIELQGVHLTAAL